MLRRFISVVVLMLAVTAVSCAKKSSDTSATMAPSQTTTAVNVTDVDLGRAVGDDKNVTEKTETFAPNDVIYASVHTTGTSSGSMLRARWTFQDGQVVEETQQNIAPTGDAVTEFHISKPDGWPAGKYKLELFVDGNPVQTKEFEVKA